MTAPCPPPSDLSAEQIAQHIASAIVEHRLPPGARLREEALARAYGVSRTKVRAALLMLSKDKLIRTVPDKGAFVSKPSTEESREVFSVRRILEAALAREFVARAKPADYRKLEQHLREERRAIAGKDARLRNTLLADFHILLAEVVGNSVLTEMLRDLSARSAVITALYQSTLEAACSSDEHHAFLAAAKAGDTDRAVQLMLDHLHHVEEALDFTDEGRNNDADLVLALLT